MSKLVSKEFKGRGGAVELRLRFEQGRVFLEDEQGATLNLSCPQARWVANEISAQVGSHQKSTLDFDRVLFLTGLITESNVKEWQKELLKIAFKELHRKDRAAKHITLFINTEGGACLHGFALMDTIEIVRGMGVPVLGLVAGAAYSMGAAILQACSRRVLARHSRMMLHQVCGGTGGSLEEVQHYLAEMAETNRRCAQVFADACNLPEGNAAYWETFMQGQDKYLSPQECVELGLADEVLEPADFRHILERLSN